MEFLMLVDTKVGRKNIKIFTEKQQGKKIIITLPIPERM
jgi:hypothetical protein